MDVKNENRNEIYLRKKIIFDENINDEGIAVYTALRKIYNSNECNYYISVKQLAYILTNTYDFQSRFLDSIKYGLNNLIDIELVKVEKQLSQSEYILNLSSLFYEYDCDVENDYYLVVFKDELNRIMNVQKSVFKLYKYFVTLISTISTTKYVYTNSVGETLNNFLGDCTIDYLAEISNISKRSICNMDNGYNKSLEDLKLIYIKRCDDFFVSNNTVKSLRNFYGRFENKKWIDKYASEYANINNSNKCNKKTNQKNANKEKSMLMKYNWLCNGKEYSHNEIHDIYEFILNYNKKYEEYKEKQKSTDIFMKLDRRLKTNI